MKENKEEFDFKDFVKQAGDLNYSDKSLAIKDKVFSPLFKIIIKSPLDLNGKLTQINL